ncbi:T9SS type A sorting domain-containing protein [Hymenobacter cavernae]|uniref:Secretion system C-terminal sorting domain-containing protein n=1 Tax=Hymenobacter cavernae TaxID=2044852 RepID=A0ABQ1TFA0_9BACT|nr:T9SS type A sorting domain-containing protein [Hymenobacter cavernae]GGE93862.1 hypothetical protein GCM10011383_00680 [Hymenobacter cavernae]
MKNQLRAFFCAAGLLWAGAATAQNTVPNASFDNWENRPLSNERPQGWLTSDDILYQLLGDFLTPRATRLIEKVSETHSGPSAALLTPKNITVVGFGSRPVPAILLLGDRFRVSIEDLANPASLADITRSRGVPFTGRPTQLNFWYVFAGAPTDQANVAVILTKGNLKNGGFTVGGGTTTMPLTSSTTEYTRFTLPITYTSEVAPDSIRMGFSIGGNQVFSSGAAMAIDDISFSTITATANPTVAGSLSVYPNPSTNGLFSLASLQNPGVATAPLSVTDALGKVVVRQAAAPASAANGRQLDLRGRPAGVYLLRLDTPEGVVVRKLQVQ